MRAVRARLNERFSACGTPLRVLCLVAFDALHRQRFFRSLLPERLRVLSDLPDFGACANGASDNRCRNADDDNRCLQGHERAFPQRMVLRLVTVLAMLVLYGARMFRNAVSPLPGECHAEVASPHVGWRLSSLRWLGQGQHEP